MKLQLVPSALVFICTYVRPRTAAIFSLVMGKATTVRLLTINNPTALLNLRHAARPTGAGWS